jgi:hypothetical protein
VTVRIFDAPVPGEPGQDALETVIYDWSTHQLGYMQASAKNGFTTTSMANCQGTPFNFEPEYSTASVGNYVPWAALQTDISTEFETGHFEPCTSVSDPVPDPIVATDSSTMYNACTGPYEAQANEGPEAGDGICWQQGDTHAGYNPSDPGETTPPDEITGCMDNLFQNGDIDFDGMAYRAGEWPTSATPTRQVPSSFVESLPTTVGFRGYQQVFFQTDIALSESVCTISTLTGCTVPPSGSEVSQPGNTAFYPFWSEVDSHGTCTLEFGDVTRGPVNDFGGDAQYGKNQFTTLGYPEFESNIMNNVCQPGRS